MRRVAVAITLVAALLGLGGSAVKAVSDRPTKPPWSHVVAPRDTLWSLARRAAPGQDPRRTVDRLIRVNHLRGGVIIPGQKLVLPR
jgi:LysM repeat protein